MACRFLTVLALLAAFAYVGCGGSRESDRDEVEKTVKAVYDALADKDAKKVCGLISEKGRKQIADAASRQGKKQTCQEVFSVGLAFAGDQLADAKKVKVTDVKLDGDQAKAAVKIAKRTTDVPLLKEDGRWKLSVLDLSAG
jgi:uncharacterized protein YgiB involved in biofilm formation